MYTVLQKFGKFSFDWHWCRYEESLQLRKQQFLPLLHISHQPFPERSQWRSYQKSRLSFVDNSPCAQSHMGNDSDKFRSICSCRGQHDFCHTLSCGQKFHLRFECGTFRPCSCLPVRLSSQNSQHTHLQQWQCSQQNACHTRKCSRHLVLSWLNNPTHAVHRFQWSRLEWSHFLAISSVSCKNRKKNGHASHKYWGTQYSVYKKCDPFLYRKRRCSFSCSRY